MDEDIYHGGSKRSGYRHGILSTVSAAAILVYHNHPSGEPEPIGEELLNTK
ncbi:MAG: JAB domain-containing protein [Thermoanaerobaculia bacterium]